VVEHDEAHSDDAQQLHVGVADFFLFDFVVHDARCLWRGGLCDVGMWSDA
jgi:hypothetical protein